MSSVLSSESRHLEGFLRFNHSTNSFIFILHSQFTLEILNDFICNIIIFRRPKAKIDYGSLIWVTLQRAKTAREAISTIDQLMKTYGYASGGESFSIADQKEAWFLFHFLLDKHINSIQYIYIIKHSF